MNKKCKERIEHLLEQVQSEIQEIHSLLTPLTDDELVDKWLPLLEYAKIPDENYIDCANELESVERNFYSTFLRASLFKKLTEAYSTVPPKTLT